MRLVPTLREDKPMYTDPKEHISGLFQSTAYWRREKAREYPDDDRNLKAASLCNELSKSVEAIPDDDPLFVEYEKLMDAIDDSEDEFGVIRASEIESDM